MISTIKRAKCLSGSHSSTDGGRRYAVSRSIVRKLSNGVHPATKKGRINAPILPKLARCAKSDRLLVHDVHAEGNFVAYVLNLVARHKTRPPSVFTLGDLESVDGDKQVIPIGAYGQVRCWLAAP